MTRCVSPLVLYATLLALGLGAAPGPGTVLGLGAAPAPGAAAGLGTALGSAKEAPRDAAADHGRLEVRLVVVGAEDLAAFEALVEYDPTILRLGDVSYGPLLPEGSKPLGPVEDGAGRLAVGSYNSRGSVASGNLELMTLWFESLGSDIGHGVSLVTAGTGAYDMAGVPIDAIIRLAGPGQGEAFFPYLSRW